MGETLKFGLVPEKTCGDCTACCTVLPIKATGFTKLPNFTCKHLVAGGCGIYETRPDACRTYYCVWRQSPRLDDTWRPDRSGVLITDEYDGIPEGYASHGLRFIVFGDESAIRKPEFAVVIARVIAANMPAFLSIPGPPGYYAAKQFLNRALDASVKANDLAGVTALLGQAMARLKSFPFVHFDEHP